MKIITTFRKFQMPRAFESSEELRSRHPPIPVRDFDWVAYFKGEEEGLVGSGKTELLALFDLYSLYTEQEERFQENRAFGAFRDAFESALSN